jgi:hypothetical protein
MDAIGHPKETTPHFAARSPHLCGLRNRLHTAKNQYQKFKTNFLGSHCPNFHLLVSVSDLYIPTIDLPIQLQEICGPILGINKSHTDKEMWKMVRGIAIPRKGIHKWDFRCSALSFDNILS